MLVPLTVGIGIGSLVTGRLVSRTGYTTIFPIIGLLIVTANFVVLAFWAGVLDMTTLAAVMLLVGLFMGTVMGVVQVSVQSAAGPLRLGEAAASVQFSRSIGAAFGTAMVATLLFAVLAVRNPESARIFASMVEHAGHAVPGAPSMQSGGIPPITQVDIAVAFRAAFLLMAAFSIGGFLLALTNPQRRI
jgi:MFS family permease